LPGNRGLLFNIADGIVPSDWDIAVATLDGVVRKVIDGGSDPRYLTSGHIVFARGGSLWAVGFDLDRLEVSGSEVRVAEDVMHAERAVGLDLNSGAAQFSVSDTGMLAIVPGGAYPRYEFSLAWFGEGGAIEPVQLDSALFTFPRVAPAGDRVAYSAGGFGDSQVWTFDLETGVPLRLTSGGHNVAPIWSVDGKQLAFARTALEGAGDGGIYMLSADGSDEPRRIAAAHLPVTSSWSAANVIAYVDGESETTESIWTLRADGKSEPQRFLPNGEVGAYPEFSPDGRWIAYAGLEHDEFIVYARPFPEGTPRIRISPGSGHAPMWSRDGRQLFYLKSASRDGSRKSLELMVVDIEASTLLRASKPRGLGTVPWGRTHPARTFDASTDGRFVFPLVPPPLPPQPVVKIEVVQNWGAELLQLMRPK